MAWVAVASTGVGVAGSIFGAIRSAREAKKNQAILDSQLAEAKTDENKSFLDTSTAKDAVKLANENLVDTRKNIAGRAAITGASDEAVVASNSGANKNYNEALSRITGLGTMYQDRAKARKNALLGTQMQMNEQQAASAGNLSGNAGDLMSTAAMMSGMSKNSLPKKTGGMGFAEGE